MHKIEPAPVLAITLDCLTDKTTRRPVFGAAADTSDPVGEKIPVPMQIYTASDLFGLGIFHSSSGMEVSVNSVTFNVKAWSTLKWIVLSNAYDRSLISLAESVAPAPFVKLFPYLPERTLPRLVLMQIRRQYAVSPIPGRVKLYSKI